MKTLQLNDLVKVSNGAERFWVKVTEFVDQKTFKGVIDSHISSGQARYGDTLVCSCDDILDIWNEETQ